MDRQFEISTDSIIQMQNFLMNIDKSNLYSSLYSTLTSDWVKCSQSAEQLGRNLYFSVILRPNNRSAYQTFITSLFSYCKSSNFISNIRDAFINQLFVPFYEFNPFPNCLDSLSLLYCLYESGAIPFDLIMNKLGKMVYQSKLLRKSVVALYIVFAPEITQIRPKLYSKFLKFLANSTHIHKIFNHFTNNIDNYKQDNWALLKKKRQKLNPFDNESRPLLKIFYDDDQDSLIEYSHSIGFNPNQVIIRDMFQPMSFLYCKMCRNK